MNILKKLSRKFCRASAKSPFISNNIRIALLRRTGISIGKDVVINEGITIVCDIGWEEHIIIEDRVAIASNVSLIATSHPNNSSLRSYSKQYPFMEVFGSIQIGHDSWLGASVSVLPNVIIGSCSIVGTGAVVTRDVPENCVVTGVPAKIMKKLNFEEIV